MKTIKRVCPLEVKAAGGEAGTFEGYGSIFGNVDSYYDVVMPGAFANSLAEYQAKGKLPKLLWQHRADEPIGLFEAMHEDGKGLYVKGRLLVDDDPLAARAWAHLKAGSIDGLSIGYAVRDAEYDEEERVLRLTDLDLWEVSLVTFPANPDALVSDVKTERDLERVLRATGCCSQAQAKAIASHFAPKEPWDAVAAVKSLSATLKG